MKNIPFKLPFNCSFNKKRLYGRYFLAISEMATSGNFVSLTYKIIRIASSKVWQLRAGTECINCYSEPPWVGGVTAVHDQSAFSRSYGVWIENTIIVFSFGDLKKQIHYAIQICL